jgi:glycerol-3-phosphate acyltransferase PlsY
MLIAVAAYLIGSVPFALILARLWGTGDLRVVGSGNIGATNVFRTSGVMPGVLAAVLDASKGALSVVLAQRLNAAPELPAVAGVAAILGHVYPVWLGFRGGKGVATAAGVFGVLTPVAALAAFSVFLAVTAVTRIVSLGSVAASLTLPGIAYVIGSPLPVLIAALAVAALIVVRHRTNLSRLRVGLEKRIGR